VKQSSGLGPIVPSRASGGVTEARDLIHSKITPVHGFAWMVASPEAITAQLYLAVVIARLVGMLSVEQEPVLNESDEAVAPAVSAQADSRR
jgi:hypothetical protein